MWEVMEKYGFWISELFECRVKNTCFMIFIVWSFGGWWLIFSRYTLSAILKNKKSSTKQKAKSNKHNIQQREADIRDIDHTCCAK